MPYQNLYESYLQVKPSATLNPTLDSSPATPGHNPPTRSRQSLGRVGPESGLSGLGRPAGPNQRQPDAAPHPAQPPQSKTPHRDSSPVTPGQPPPPCTRQIRAGWGRSQALAVWAGLPDRTSAD